MEEQPLQSFFLKEMLVFTNIIIFNNMIIFTHAV